LKEKTEQLRETLPKTNQIKSKIKHQFVEPLEAKASRVKKTIKSKSEHVCRSNLISIPYLISFSYLLVKNKSGE
jgi:hypothetical protein